MAPAPTFRPGDTVTWQGGDIPELGIKEGGSYEVAAFNPGQAAELELVGVPGMWAVHNFQVTARPSRH